MLNRLQSPPIKDAVEFDLQLRPYEKWTLDNGVEVYSINAGAEEVLQLEWVFRSGNWYEEKNMVASATNFLLKNGTIKKTAFDLNEAFDYYGAYLNRSCYSETATITLHCLNKYAGELLPLVAEIIMESVFPEDEIKLFKRNNKQRLEVNLKKGDFVANRLIDTYLYGENHPYGKYSTFAALESLERKQLQDFYDSYYRNGKCVMFVAGKIPEGMFALLNKHFGQLPINQAKTLKKQIIKPATEKKYRVQNDVNGVQGAIRIARPFPNRHHPDFLPVLILNNLFGGFFGSRLMDNIREDKGYTYGIHSYIQNHVHECAWMVSTEAGRDVSEATVKEVYIEMEQLRNELVDEEELLLVKNYMMGSILGDLDGPFHIIAKWKNIILNGLDEDYFNRSVQTIKSISALELKELANKYLQPEEFYELVVV